MISQLRSIVPTRLRQEDGFIPIGTLELQIVIAAIGFYAAFTIPHVLHSHSWLPFFGPLTVIYIGGCFAAVIFPAKEPSGNESCLERGIRFGHIALVLTTFALFPLCILFLILFRLVSGGA